MASIGFEAPCPQLPQTLDPFNRWAFPDGAVWLEFHRAESGYLLRFPGLADFTVSHDGRRVTGKPVRGTSGEMLRHLLFNQVIPLARSMSGSLVFHASAVELAGAGVAFMGESRRGKSTLAAHFATAGNRFLADDGLVVEAAGRGYRVMPSQPSIRLWEDSKNILIGSAVREAPPLQYTSKATFLADVSVPYCDEPRPLHRVYFLGEGTAAEIAFESVTPSAVLLELVRHSFLLDPTARDVVAAQFERLSQLAVAPVFYRLDYPRRFDLLDDVQAAIVDHFNR